MEIVILILGLCFIFKDEVKSFFMRFKNEDEEDEEQIEKRKAVEESFNALMNYSLEDAINSKRNGGDE